MVSKKILSKSAHAMSGAKSVGSKPKGLSLHVGLNRIDPAHYDGNDGELGACVGDAEAMEALARAQGYGVMNVLRDDQGTREAVMGSISDAAKQLNPGDMFLFTYSGHGSQTFDLNKDEDANDDDGGLDETWCLYNGMLVDDEAYELWKKFKPGVRVLVLLDCCHSGSAIKAMPLILGAEAKKNQPRARVLSTSSALKTFKANETFYKGIQDGIAAQAAANPNKEVVCNVRLISGCQDNQLSMDGMVNGAFTGKLLKEWGGGGFAGNYAEFHKAIVFGMLPTQTPNHMQVGAADAAYDAQRPFLI
jgi:metacaspase-1